MLSFIVDHVERKGYPPSVREICSAVGLASSSTAHGHLSRLEEKGYLHRDPTKPRAIELTAKVREVFPHFRPFVHAAPPHDSEQFEAVRAPFIGRVTAGLPILAIEDWQDTLLLPKQWAGRDDVFILTVSGDSMIDAGIWDGDMVIVRKQDHAQDGDIVVALINGEEATVKRFYKESNRVRLQAENPAYAPIYTTDARILGKVIGLYREI